ncbi:MAG: TerB family tellurite resistance protein [Planctomycetota bacterium]
MQSLSRADRLRLLEFVCSFAWTDLRVSQRERTFVARLVEVLGLDDDERRQVARWLEVPPAPEQVDPTEIPLAHRQLFLEAARRVVAADGVNPAERDALDLFSDLISS